MNISVRRALLINSSILLCFLLFGCRMEAERTTTDRISGKVIESTVIQFLNKMAVVEGLKNRVLVHDELPVDNVKTLIIKSVLKHGILTDSTEIKLVNILLADSSKRVLFQFPNRFYFVGQNEVIEFDGDEGIFSKPNFYGTINLTNAAVIENQGCYYFAINCGNNCSQGFLVFTKLKDSTNWDIYNVVKLWDS